ncbi:MULTISPECIES: 2-C-methyl-D-erythritol 4-phosphate cytidylyltransferase [Caproicibacterium]|jgi:2-C-methyl-D-erythritol 4-phosphate cytidylyltransferase|uniref:2-C-methyl-D-erythritol 4-phosphate cytidylyltransferase n=2 Tax=Caproicibacterium lactatifermentans TaxID=2666138 RepID=A0A859DTM5_9FIRM|nr:2-C-methyl-D-erythritol 4-phosphate cytidylyltransferase [Caproicibacterium lactatifermentans]QKN23543.1 2-C-methyl-D-erythritol 4-phosphate cytidylyltransferase [Caproicibacterium lactatifermentans]
MQVKYAIFDMDGTLLDSMHVWDNLGEDILSRHGISAQKDMHTRLRAMTVEDSARYFRTLGVQESMEAIMEEINTIPYERYRTEVQPKPGAVAFLQRLHQQGTPMCIVSSTDARSIRAVFDRLGVTQLFQFILSTNDFGSGKDRPEIFQAAARGLGGTPEETVVFEDALYAIRTAKMAGFPVAALADAEAKPEKPEIQELADVYLPDLRYFPWETADGLPEVSCCAVIVAAGASTRMGRPKQEIPLGGKPALVHTLSAFEQAKTVQRVILVCPPGQEAHFRALAVKNHCTDKLAAIVPGGDTRQKSAAAGAKAAGACRLLAIHDGARVLVTPEEIDRAVADAAQYGASALAVPVKDTIKKSDENGLIIDTPERRNLWAVQTPQVFCAKAYRSLLSGGGQNLTDDCQLFEHAGYPVHLCRGSYTNFKLTTPDDVPAAEAVLRKRGEK